MAELKKVGMYDIFWAFDKRFSVEHAYDAIKELIPEEDFIFANYGQGPNYFTWIADGEGWAPLSSADETECGIIMGIYTETVARITAKMDKTDLFANLDYNKFVEVPSLDDCLFYKQDKDSPTGYRIQLAAWGHVLPPSKAGGNITGGLYVDERVRVSVAFVRAGERVPNTKFSFERPDGLSKDFITDNTGVFSLGLIIPGRSYKIRHCETSKIFTLDVANTHKIYEYDVTQFAELEVTLLRDDMPVAGENVSIRYGKEDYNRETNTEGKVVIKLPLIEGLKCDIDALGESRTTELSSPITRVEFSIVTPEPENVEPAYTPIIKVVCDGGEGCPNHKIFVDYNKTYIPYTTDDYGQVQLPEMDGSGFMTIIDGDNPANNEKYKIDLNQTEYIFVIHQDRIIHVNVCDDYGNNLTAGHVTFTQNGIAKTFELDANGNFIFNATQFLENTPIDVDLSLEGRRFYPNNFTYTTTESQYQIVIKEYSTPWWIIFIKIIAIILLLLLLQMGLDWLLIELGYQSLIFF